MNLQKELFQDVDLSVRAVKKPGDRSTPRFEMELCISAEVKGMMRAGTFALAAKVPVGCSVIDATEHVFQMENRRNREDGEGQG